MTISAQSRATLRSVNWFWPAYMSRGYVMELIARLDTEPVGPGRNALFEASLPSMYSSGHLASMLTDRYAHVPLVRLFQCQLGEAIEASHLGIYHAAVALLIPTIEGVVREHARQEQRDLRNASRSNLNVEVRSMIDHERTSHPGCSASDERIAMIEMFGEFLADSLYLDTPHFTGNRELNRHGAVHGIYRDYGSASNFYVLISIVDLLSFVLTFRTSGVSMMPPELTLQSRRLALYYLGLRDVARVAAKAAGARR